MPGQGARGSRCVLQAHGPAGHTETWGAQVHGARWAGLLQSGRVSAAGHLPLDLPALLSCQDGPCAAHSDPAPLPRLWAPRAAMRAGGASPERPGSHLGAEGGQWGAFPLCCFPCGETTACSREGLRTTGRTSPGPESIPAKDSPSSPPLALRSCHPSLAPRTPPSPVPS